jgi:hypothetical protein
MVNIRSGQTASEQDRLYPVYIHSAVGARMARLELGILKRVSAARQHKVTSGLNIFAKECIDFLVAGYCSGMELVVEGYLLK